MKKREEREVRRQCYYLGLGAANGPGADRARLVESGEDLGDAAVGDEQLPGDVAGTHPHQRQLHDATPHAVRQGASVHKNPAQLVHTGLTCGRTWRHCESLGQTAWSTGWVGSKRVLALILMGINFDL
jgi:hypothetical protein